MDRAKVHILVEKGPSLRKGKIMKKFQRVFGFLMALIIVSSFSIYAKAYEEAPIYLEDVKVGSSYYSQYFPGIIRRDCGEIHFNYYADENPEHLLLQVRFQKDGGEVVPEDGIFDVEFIRRELGVYRDDSSFKIEVHANQYRDTNPSEPKPAEASANAKEAHASHAAEAQMAPAKNSNGTYMLNYYGVPVIYCSVCNEPTVDYGFAQQLWMSEVKNAVMNKQDFDTEWKFSAQESEDSVTITSSTFYSFDKDTLEYLSNQPVAVTLKFRYQNNYYETVVPANYDWTQFALDGEWAGFGQILKVCGGKLITEEEFRK